MPIAIGWIVSTILPALFKYGGQFVTGSGAIIAAAFGALPGVMSAFVEFCKAVSQSPLLAFVTSGVVFGSLCFIWGLKYDAPLRKQIQERAISAANYKADLAIARNKRDYATQVKAICSSLTFKTRSNIPACSK